jgi:hypothetical protein
MVGEYHIRRDIQSHDLSSILKYFLNNQPSPHVNLIRLLMNYARLLPDNLSQDKLSPPLEGESHAEEVRIKILLRVV